MPLIDANCKLLLHFDGADTSQTITDSSGQGHTFTAVNTAQLDTAQYKFGSASLLLDGDSDSVYTADSTDWSLGTGDFTIDFWVRFATLPSSGGVAFITSQYQDGANRWSTYLYNNGGTYQWSIQNIATGQTSLDEPKTSPGLSVDTWYHVAYVRTGNNIMTFQNGTQCGTSQAYSGNWVDISGNLEIGTRQASGFLNGWLDELNFVKGTALYTNTFTPPTLPYGTLPSTGGGCFMTANTRYWG